MKITELGRVTENSGSPTLFETDRGSYLVQGWRITDPEALAAMSIPGHETVVEIPKAMLGFAREQS